MQCRKSPLEYAESILTREETDGGNLLAARENKNECSALALFSATQAIAELRRKLVVKDLQGKGLYFNSLRILLVYIFLFQSRWVRSYNHLFDYLIKNPVSSGIRPASLLSQLMFATIESSPFFLILHQHSDPYFSQGRPVHTCKALCINASWSKLGEP